jgi:hypothetical protein
MNAIARFKIWIVSVKEDVLAYGLIAFVWIFVVHGVGVFLLSAGMASMAMSYADHEYPIYVTLAAFVLSTPALVALFRNLDNQDAIWAYLVAGWLAGALASIIVWLVSPFLQPPAGVAATFVVGFAATAAFIYRDKAIQKNKTR